MAEMMEDRVIRIPQLSGDDQLIISSLEKGLIDETKELITKYYINADRNDPITLKSESIITRSLEADLAMTIIVTQPVISIELLSWIHEHAPTMFTLKSYMYLCDLLFDIDSLDWICSLIKEEGTIDDVIMFMEILVNKIHGLYKSSKPIYNHVEPIMVHVYSHFRTIVLNSTDRMIKKYTTYIYHCGLRSLDILFNNLNVFHGELFSTIKDLEFITGYNDLAPWNIINYWNYTGSNTSIEPVFVKMAIMNTVTRNTYANSIHERIETDHDISALIKLFSSCEYLDDIGKGFLEILIKYQDDDKPWNEIYNEFEPSPLSILGYMYVYPDDPDGMFYEFDSEYQIIQTIPNEEEEKEEEEEEDDEYAIIV